MKLKRGDVAVIVICVLLFVVSFFVCLVVKKNGKTVNVYEDNKLVYSGSLFEDKTVNLSHNTVIIKNNNAFMKESTCKNQICVKTGKISKSRECIVCLPNKVIIEIE